MILKNQLAGNTWATASHTEAFFWFYCGAKKSHPLSPWRIWGVPQIASYSEMHA